MSRRIAALLPARGPRETRATQPVARAGVRNRIGCDGAARRARTTTMSVRATLLCFASCGLSRAAADDRTLHTAATSPSVSPPRAMPISPYDPPPSPSRAGQLELGAAFGATIAADVRDLSATVLAGRFVTDWLELSALASVAHL